MCIRDLKAKSLQKKFEKCIYIWVYVDVGAGTRVDDSSDHNNLITKMPDDVDNVGGWRRVLGRYMYREAHRCFQILLSNSLN